MCPTGTSLRPANATATATSEFRRAFDVIDADHDGKISGDDLRTFYAASLSSGAGNDDEEMMIKAMMTVADENNDGYVQYDEFERVLKERKWRINGGEIEKQGNKEKWCDGDGDGDGDGGVMEEMFRVMDQDGDGRLGLEDLRSYLGRAGLSVGDEEIKAMIRLGGGDERDGVSFDGFVNILAVTDLVN